jgi:hypothetical protein
MKSYISVILITALLLASLFFALPKTENLLPFAEERFDLNRKEDAYWKKEVILELSIEPKDRSLREQKVDEAKNVIYKRLKKVGVEEIQIVSYQPTQEELENRFRVEEDEGYIEEFIKIIIQTTKDEALVNRLITSTGQIKIMQPKEELDELSQEDQMQLYMEENYEETGWNRCEFRNILINDLRAGDGERSYFGIFKPNFGKKGAFTEFLKENEGERIGVLMDNFVIPIQITEDMTTLFAVGLGPDESEAKIQNIILNTGVIRVERISVLSSEELEPNIYEVDHIQISLAILISIASIIFFLYQREKEEKEKILQFAFSLLLIFSISFTVLKIWQIPVDMFLLILAGILGTIFVKTMYTCAAEAKMILLMTVLVSILMVTLGTGYVPLLGNFVLFVILLSFITELLTKTYFKHIKIINN